jgi:hypothetical protein
MAEVNSAQAVLVAAGNKIKHCDHGKVESIIITTPATFAQLAIGDTLASGQFIPKGSRILDVWKGHGTGTASSTLDIGLRKRDGTVVDADGLSALTTLTTATTIDLSVGTGALLAAGVDYVTADDVEVYCTAQGAVLAANQDVRIRVDYIGP